MRTEARCGWGRSPGPHARDPRSQRQDSARKRTRDGSDQGRGRVHEHTVSQIDLTREHLIETYRKKAKHYHITSRLYPRRVTPSGHNASERYKHSTCAGVTV